MSVRGLEYLFSPRSVALIGASEKPHSVGATVLRNLVSGGYAGSIFPVNPKYKTLTGLAVHSSVEKLPQAPDLAVVCTPPATIPGIIEDLGAKGCKAVVVLTAGLGAVGGDNGGDARTVAQAMLAAASAHKMRVLGPNCVGLLVPALGLNASFSHTDALPGHIAFVSQSGALVTAVLDWAKTRGIGFSKFISLGDSADIDFGDVLDYLASDPDTKGILMYMEDVRHARKFMSAARAAARSKPTLVVKAGRAPEGAKAASSHTGALAGSDAVYDAALRRAGILRVATTEDLFDAVETLAGARPLYGERLTIMTNGGGPGVMATDELIVDGGKLAPIAEATMRQLNDILPSAWSHGNPVDIIGDAPVERYVAAMQALLQDPQSDAVLFIHAPTAIVPSADIARTLVPVLASSSRTVLSCWLGGDAVAEAKSIFVKGRIPVYDTPEDAVHGFMQIVNYRRNQALLMQVPPSMPTDFLSDVEAARRIVRTVLDERRKILSEPEAKAVLAAYGVPVVRTRVAADVDDAVKMARDIGFPVALKILSPDITHKSDVGGVALDLDSAEAVRTAADAMIKRVQQLRPQAGLQGFSVQTMVRRPDARELIVGATTDRTFGPVILFGQGGTAVEVIADRALALPPLNMVLAQDLVAQTKAAKFLAGFRNYPPADLNAVCLTLVQISHLVTDIPEIAELDINPLLADSHGVVALDARIKVERVGESAHSFDRLAIRPYPQELEQKMLWHGRDLYLRPIRPEDAEAHKEFFALLSPEDMRFRMFVSMRGLSLAQLSRFTQIDYDREMAFIATRPRADGRSETLGVARAVADPDNSQAEFAIVVRSDLKRSGLGTLLMTKLIDYCRMRGTGVLIGEVLPDNTCMLGFATRFGFEEKFRSEDSTVHLHLNLRS